MKFERSGKIVGGLEEGGGNNINIVLKHEILKRRVGKINLFLDFLCCYSYLFFIYPYVIATLFWYLYSVCMCIIFMCIYMYMCPGQRKMSNFLTHHSLPYPLDTSLSMNLRLAGFLGDDF